MSDKSEKLTKKDWCDIGIIATIGMIATVVMCTIIALC